MTTAATPYDYDAKIIHVGTPGIFHKLRSPALAFETRCGRDASDCRATAHRLEDYQPCVVCWTDFHRPLAVDDAPELAEALRQIDHLAMGLLDEQPHEPRLRRIASLCHESRYEAHDRSALD